MPDRADAQARDAKPGGADAPEWIRAPERGSPLLLKLMSRFSLRCGRPSARVLLYVIAAYFFVFAPAARRHMRQFLARALGRAPRPRERFRQVFSFAATILDRLYFLHGRIGLFSITLEGEPLLEDLLSRGQGAFLLGAHFGSFAALGALGQAMNKAHPDLRIAMAMFEENAAKIRSALDVLEPPDRPEVIALGSPHSMLRLQERLESGAFVGVLGDRLRGQEPAVSMSFLGHPARFPLGPLRAAALLRRSVVFMAGLYRGGNRYHLVFEPLADFSAVPAGERDAAVAAALARYVAMLERYCRNEPWNWFNFYDFWAGGAGAP